MWRTAVDAPALGFTASFFVFSTGVCSTMSSLAFLAKLSLAFFPSILTSSGSAFSSCFACAARRGQVEDEYKMGKMNRKMSS